MIHNGFVLQPSNELLPDYKICPFSNDDLRFNRSLPDNNIIDDYFAHRFHQKKFQYTLNARGAINIALLNFQLHPDDVVTILTTTGNYYVSSCVVREIEKYCTWSREIEEKTKILFVIHEFGYPYEGLKELTRYKIPIIEDCAYSFFTEDKNKIIGAIGDFAIYSFPKTFPLQLGGLLVNNSNTKIQETTFIENAEKRYIRNVLSYYIQTKDQIMERRLINYAYLSKEFKKLGLTERISFEDGTIPGVFMFRINNHHTILPELKTYFYDHGIQCSVFYGEESFFIPVHQALTECDLDYFTEVMKSFLSKQVG